jgi:hypothetical protein
MRRKYKARAGIALMIIVFVIRTGIILYNSGGWGTIALFYSILTGCAVGAFVVHWCIENWNS